MSKSNAAKKPALNLARLGSVVNRAVQGVEDFAEKDIPLDKIYSEAQVRFEFGDLQELAERLKKEQLMPLLVLLMPDGRYKVIAGERRFRAAPMAGYTKIRCRVLKGDFKPEDLRRIQVSENMDRKNLTALEEAQGVTEDVEKYGFDIAMEIWGKSKPWISKRMATTKYAPEIKALLESGACGDFEILGTLNQLRGYETPAYQAIIADLHKGAVVSRDYVRDTLSRAKLWKQEQERIEQEKQAQQAKEAAAKAPEPAATKAPAKAPVSPVAAPASSKEGAAKPHSTSEASTEEGKPGQAQSASEDGQGANAEADAKKHAQKIREEHQKQLVNKREEVFEWGEVNEETFRKMRELSSSLEMSQEEAEWVQWQGFLAMVLPMLNGIGKERGAMYVKKLQNELKQQEPRALWEQLHGKNGENDVPSMPANWHF